MWPRQSSLTPVQWSSGTVGAALVPLLLWAPLLVLSESEEEVPSVWQTWKRSYRVSYNEEHEDFERQTIWQDNMRRIEENNQGFLGGSKMFTMAMNKYGDLTRQEYKRLQGVLINSNHRRGKTASARMLRASAKVLGHVAVDYRDTGLVSEVKDQGYCGSCWAFSTTGAIEGQMFKKTAQRLSLSEQNLVDCSKSYGTHGCQGAWMANAYDYVVKNGLQSTSTYPYTSVDTQPCFFDSRKTVAHISDYKFIPKGDEQALADAVATIGPITIALDADHPSFLFYSSGIYEEPRCNPNNLNHAVLLVGYGSDDGQDYWIIKNSWGTGWGEGGYMRMIRNGRNTCGIANYAMYPLL